MATSPKSILSVPRKDGIVVGSSDVAGRGGMNQTAQVRSADKLATLDDDEKGAPARPTNAESKTLADTIQENMNNATRPKTRGDPIIKNLDSSPIP